MLKAFISVFLLTIFVGGYTFAADSKNKTVEKERPEYFNGVKIIYGDKEPEKIPKRAIMEQFLGMTRIRGYQTTRSVFFEKMQIGEIKADWFLALAERVQFDHDKLTNESDICKYLHSLNKPDNQISNKDTQKFYKALKKRRNEVVLAAMAEIEQKFTATELERLNQYIAQNITPNTTYVPTDYSSQRKYKIQSPIDRHKRCFETKQNHHHTLNDMESNNDKHH